MQSEGSACLKELIKLKDWGRWQGDDCVLVHLEQILARI
jgi:hypothetical protein